MTLILHLIFLAAAVVHVVGVTLDYRNSLGRGEQNLAYQDEHGYFAPAKFRRATITFFIVTVTASFCF